MKNRLALVAILGNVFWHSAVLRSDTFTNFLSGRTVVAIAVDPVHHWIWFGTEGHGVIRFDGLEFKEYNVHSTSQGLPSDFVTALAVDHNGTLWGGTSRDGAFRFDGRRWWNDPASPLREVTCLVVDNRGQIWFGSHQNGVFKFDGMTWTNYNTSNSALKSDEILSLAIDAGGNKWIGTALEGASRLDSDELNWRDYAIFNSSSIFVNTVNAIAIDAKGNKWFGTGDGVYKLLGDNETWDTKLEPDSLVYQEVHDIGFDQESNVWFATDNGISRLDSNETVWQHFSEQDGLAFNRMRDLAIDEDGNIWFGLLGHKGASRFNFNWLVFGEKAIGLGRNSYFIRCMTADKTGHLWLGTDSGVSFFDGSKWVPRKGQPDPIGGLTDLRAIAIDDSGGMWFGSWERGVSRLVGEQRVNFTQENTGGGLVDNRVFAMAASRDEIWIGTYRGLSRYNLTERRWMAFTVASTDGGLASDVVYTVAIDTAGGIWCGTPAGVSKFDGNNWQRFTVADGLGSDLVWSIAASPKGAMWLGTGGGGLSRFKNGVMETFTLADGLPSNEIYSLKAQDDATVWIGTPAGVSHLDEEGVWTTYTTLDGLSENFTVAIETDGQNHVWFGTWGGGLCRYRPTVHAPETTILSRFDITSLPEVTFRYIGADLNTPAQNLRYQFKLDNAPWSEYSYAAFTTLAIPEEGRHTFYVRAIDKDNNVDPTPAANTFYKIALNRGNSTSFVDRSGIHGLDSVQISLFWPPNQFDKNVEIIIEPVSVENLPEAALFAFDLKFKEPVLNFSKPAILAFSFPLHDNVRGKQWSIYHEQNPEWMMLGGTTKIDGGTVTLATAIQQLGRYAVQEIGGMRTLNAVSQFAATVQPRIFSPRGGGHGEQATISFKLERSEHVRIQVYNLAGRLVDMIWNESMNAGINAVAWNGRDKHGQFCPSGLYLITIESSGFLSPPKPVKVMVLNQ